MAKKAVTTKKTEKKLSDNKKTQRPQNKNLKSAKGEPGPGRPKGKLNFDTRVDMAIEFLANEMIKAHNAKKENKNKQISMKDIDIEGDIFAQLINKARSGDVKMIDSFLDRRHGKAKQPIELGGMNGNPILIEERKKEAKSKARKMLDMWTKNKSN